MLEPVGLNPIDFERLMFTLESAAAVNQRVQFHLWAQGALQSFLPHETLLCVHGDLAQRRYAYEVFSRAVLSEDFNRLFGDHVDGLIPEILEHWYANAQAPLTFHDEDIASERTARQLASLGLLPALIHGSRGLVGQHATLFVMLRTPAAIDARERYMVELLVPHLHLAWHRVLSVDCDASEERVVAAGSQLTDREIEVLNWVREGKTNIEIAVILRLSPLTVKNHVRKILRKLKVSNRAQAVARGLAARVFRNFVERPQAAPSRPAAGGESSS